jgi:AcrR family transcriptional regulator
MKVASPYSSASGRKAQPKRNDERILGAARRIFLANPNAPISAVAAEARVGISALCLRYRGKNELLRRLCSDDLQRYIAETLATLAGSADVWIVYAGFMRRIVEADTHSLVLRLTGIVKPSKEPYRQAAKSRELTVNLFERVKAAAAIRSDIEVVNIALIFEQRAAVQVGGPRRTAQLRQRYLALKLDALRAPHIEPLPGPSPDWQDMSSRWER